MKKNIALVSLLQLCFIFSIISSTVLAEDRSGEQRMDPSSIISYGSGKVIAGQSSILKFAKKQATFKDSLVPKVNAKVACQLEEIKCITDNFTSECPSPPPSDEDLVLIGLTADLIKSCVLSSKPECKEYLPIVCTSPETSKFNEFVQSCTPSITWTAKCTEDASMKIKAECNIKDDVEFKLKDIPENYYFCYKSSITEPAKGSAAGKIDGSKLQFFATKNDGKQAKGFLTGQINPKTGASMCCIGPSSDPCDGLFTNNEISFGCVIDNIIDAKMCYKGKHDNDGCKLLLHFDSLLD